MSVKHSFTTVSRLLRVGPPQSAGCARKKPVRGMVSGRPRERYTWNLPTRVVPCDFRATVPGDGWSPRGQLGARLCWLGEAGLWKPFLAQNGQGGDSTPGTNS